jgi:hypothetical protein
MEAVMRVRCVCMAGLVALWACAPGERASTAEAATTDSATTAAASSSPAPAVSLDPSRGGEVGLVFESYLSPWQEGDEEANTPRSTPSQFKSTTPSQTRAQREAAGHRAHGMVRFSNDLSRAWVDVKVEGVDLSAVNMFHIHCGRPGILGPILVDFAQATNLRQNIADGTFSVEITDETIAKTTQAGEGLVGVATMGCTIPSPSLGSNGPVKTSTIAGMALLARAGELYFNLHTTGQSYYGDVRGQLLPAASASGTSGGAN